MGSDCRHNRSAAVVAVNVDGAASVTATLTPPRSCKLDVFITSDGSLDMGPGSLVGELFALVQSAMVSRRDLIGVCNDLISFVLAPQQDFADGRLDALSLLAEIGTQLERNGSLFGCIAGMNSSEKLRLVRVFQPVECLVGDGGFPQFFGDCPCLADAFATLSLNCSHAAQERGRSRVYGVDLQSPGRLVLTQCGSPTAVAMQLYAVRGGQAPRHYSSAEDDSMPSWRAVGGFEDDQLRSTQCRGQSGASAGSSVNLPALVTEWLEPGAYALVVGLYTAGSGARDTGRPGGVLLRP